MINFIQLYLLTPATTRTISMQNKLHTLTVAYTVGLSVYVSDRWSGDVAALTEHFTALVFPTNTSLLKEWPPVICVCVRTDHLTVHLMCVPVRVHALVNSRVCTSFLGCVFVCECNCKRVHFAWVCTSLSSTQSPNQMSPKPRRHVSRW